LFEGLPTQECVCFCICLGVFSHAQILVVEPKAISLIQKSSNVIKYSYGHSTKSAITNRILQTFDENTLPSNKIPQSEMFLLCHPYQGASYTTKPGLCKYHVRHPTLHTASTSSHNQQESSDSCLSPSCSTSAMRPREVKDLDTNKGRSLYWHKSGSD
jgi:hypothetical protein